MFISTWKAGFIFPFSNHFNSIPICDLFHLGGPHCIRGFKYRGAGPITGRKLKKVLY